MDEKLNTDDPDACMACIRFHSDDPCIRWFGDMAKFIVANLT